MSRGTRSGGRDLIELGGVESETERRFDTLGENRRVAQAEHSGRVDLSVNEERHRRMGSVHSGYDGR